MLAKNYDGRDLTGYLASEKFDGVRAFWSGKTLLTRNGKKLSPPPFWLENLPPFEVEGELFVGRGEFEKTSSIVKTAGDSRWAEVKFLIFDAPSEQGGILERLKRVQIWLEKQKTSVVTLIKQHKLNSTQEAFDFLDEVVKRGGEGVVVRDAARSYEHGRSDSVLKIKKFDDSECEVVGEVEGKGRLKGRLGAVLCRDFLTNQILRIGTGFSDSEREKGFEMGEVLTYKFNGRTKNGKPRFVRFWRKRGEETKR